jgi:hypothetical protein
MRWTNHVACTDLEVSEYLNVNRETSSEQTRGRPSEHGRMISILIWENYVVGVWIEWDWIR